jgi:hypothetical protein
MLEHSDEPAFGSGYNAPEPDRAVPCRFQTIQTIQRCFFPNARLPNGLDGLFPAWDFQTIQTLFF